MKQWPTAARRWQFALRDVSCRQSCHLSTPSHPRVPPGWPYCRQAQCGRWRSLKWSIADLLTSSHPQMSASHLLGLQGPQQTPACRTSSKRKYLNVSCCALTPCGIQSKLLKSQWTYVCTRVCQALVCTYVWCKSRGSKQDSNLWEICQGYEMPPSVKMFLKPVWVGKIHGVEVYATHVVRIWWFSNKFSIFQLKRM